ATASGVFVSTNAGATWAPASAGLPDNPLVSELEVDPTNPLAASAYPPGGLPATPFVSELEVDPTNPLVAYAYAPAGGIFKTTDGGGSWALKQNGLASPPLGLGSEIDP